MTDTPAAQPPEPTEAPAAAPPPEATEEPTVAPPELPREAPPPARGTRLGVVILWLYAVGFVVLGAAVTWVWQHPQGPPAPPPSVPRAVTEQLATIQSRLTALEARPVPQPDLQPIQSEIAALKARLEAQPKTAAAPAPNLAPLTARLDALEQKIAALNGLGGQVAKLAADQQGLADKADKQQAMAQSLRATITNLTQRLDQDEAHLASMRQELAKLSRAASETARLARLQAARAALAAGQPLGDIPDAPPALRRFATTPPPTETSLRLAFPAAAKAALAASRPSTEGQPFLSRLWRRAETLVTIREGDRVIVGDPATGLVAAARARLDAGDLAGAVAALSKLTGPAAQAMAGWLDQARALLAARAALDAMAAHA